MRIKVLDIAYQTMADGPGFRTAIYCAGCKHCCKGCHNPQSWDFEAGNWMEVDELLDIIKADSMSNVSFSGGDPMYQAPAFTELARRIKEETGKTIWCWTGFTYEEVLADKEMSAMLPWIDVLVDGPFILEQRRRKTLFRGRLKLSPCASGGASFPGSGVRWRSRVQSGTGLPRR